jgi:hypothetical protein
MATKEQCLDNKNCKCSKSERWKSSWTRAMNWARLATELEATRILFSSGSGPATPVTLTAMPASTEGSDGSGSSAASRTSTKPTAMAMLIFPADADPEVLKEAANMSFRRAELRDFTPYFEGTSPAVARKQ